MKKIFALLFAAIFIIAALSACAENKPAENTTTVITDVPPISQTTPTISTTATTASTNAPVVITPYVPEQNIGYFAYSINHTYWDFGQIDDKIFISRLGSYVLSEHENYSSNLFRYYSKADGKVHVFCSDPTCDHVNYDGTTYTTKCVAAMIGDGIAFSSDFLPYFINSRFYFTFFHEIYSCDVSGGDLRLEYSFDNYRGPYEIKENEEDDPSLVYYHMSNYFIHTSKEGNNIVFTNYDTETKELILYEYDTVSKKLTNVSEKIKEYGAKIGKNLTYANSDGDKIYFYDISNGETYKYSRTETGSRSSVIPPIKTVSDVYVTSDDFASVKHLDSFDFLSIDSGVGFETDGGTLDVEYENGAANLVLYRDDGSKSVVSERFFEKEGLRYGVRPLYFDGISLNFVYEYELDLMRKYRLTQGFQNQSGGKLYRLDIKTGKVTAVIDDEMYDKFEVIDVNYARGTATVICERNTIISQEGTKNQTRKTESDMYVFDIDSNGRYVNPRPVEMVK